MRRVKIFWWQGDERHHVAELAERDDGIVALSWSPFYLESSINLSPFSLRKEGGVIVFPRDPFDGVHGLFNDHVPDGFGRQLLRRAFDHRGVRISKISPLDMLQYIGDRGMGALSFEPSLGPDEKWAGTEVDLDELNTAVEPILAGTPSAVFDEFVAGGASPNGARPKFLATLAEGRFYVGGEKTSGEEWLIKFAAPIDPPDSALVEFCYFLMARAAGLEIAECRLFESKAQNYFGTRRFDRDETGRIHMHSLSGMLNVDPRNFSVSYEDFAALTRRITRKAIDLERVFRIAAFNIYSCNQDDHTKNVAFLMDNQGSWRIAPAYDLSFHLTRTNEHKMPLNKTGKPTKADVLAFGENIGIKASRAREVNEEVIEGVSSFRRYAKEVGLSRKRIKSIRSEIEKRLS